MNNYNYSFSGYRYFITYEGFDREFIDTNEIVSENKYIDLYESSFSNVPSDIDSTGRFLLFLGSCFIEDLTHDPDAELMREDIVIEPSEDRIAAIMSSVPFVIGAEYVNEEWIFYQYRMLCEVYAAEIEDYEGTVNYYLAEKSQDLSASERIFFHLVESGNETYEFAFVATYGIRTFEDKIKHVPLNYALTEYAEDNKQLIELLACLERVADVCPMLEKFITSGELFYPIYLTSEEAYDFLICVEDIENVGVICRIPNWWKRNAANLTMNVKLGDEKPTYLGFDTIVGMKPTFSLDGVDFSEEDIRRLLNETEGLAFLKGKWVSVNHARLRALLKKIEDYKGDMTLMEAMRMDLDLYENIDPDGDIPIVTNGEWLNKMLAGLRNPATLKKTKPPVTVKANLRPYQAEGYEWLRNMDKYGFGACLADDMGLGKTVQVLTFLEYIRRKNKNSHVLLIVPASLIGNWVKEVEKFTPAMPVMVYHGRGGENMDRELDEYGRTFLSITTYGMALRMEGFVSRDWDCLILDEAQAIKNPVAKQTRKIKRINARMKIAMTGTPIENDLTNLWSLFDFLDRGLLGSSKDFDKFASSLKSRPEGYARLKGMISPFMLRRVKTDKRIIADLPDKVENISYVSPAKKQVILYRKYVDDLALKIEQAKGIERKGLILAALTKLKQICNHPDQYTGQEEYLPKDSGKFEVLRDICETIAQKRERVIVFTQFKEIIPYLDEYLADIFDRQGLSFHGSTPVKTREKLVEKFQGEDYVPYIVISVKAGGTGLNLTAANHVIHFDRWWNPAVENQATDRAFRIGQDKKVMVYKLVCRGTIEERIDAMITDKMALADSVIGSSSGENWITDMDNEELMNLLRLEV